MADPQAACSRTVYVSVLIVLLCAPVCSSRPLAGSTSLQQPNAGAPALPAAPVSLKPGTPAVATGGSGAAARAGGRQNNKDADMPGSYGWLFPVQGKAARGNCVVYEAKGKESLQDVARLFGLSDARLLADNQGVVSDASEALGGKSILLCGQHGQAAPKPVGAAAAAKAEAADMADEAGMRVSRKASQTAPVISAVPPKMQEQALLQLKAYLDPAGTVLQHWGPVQVAPESRVTTTTHCTWNYVSCDANENVIRLNLVYLGLEGKLPPAALLTKLPHLTELYLGGNQLQGTLPADWAASTKLTQLYLNDNQLSGPLPAEWGNMKTLRVLSLPYNQFTGALPSAWSKLDKLEDLKLNNNQLAGPVPPSWAAMSQLSTITLWNNENLSGCLPSAWAAKGSSGKGFFQTPTGVLSDDVKVATLGTAITGFCSASGNPAAASATAQPKAATDRAAGNNSKPSDTPSTAATAVNPGGPTAANKGGGVAPTKPSSTGSTSGQSQAASKGASAPAGTSAAPVSDAAAKSPPPRDARPAGRH